MKNLPAGVLIKIDALKINNINLVEYVNLVWYGLGVSLG